MMVYDQDAEETPDVTAVIINMELWAQQRGYLQTHKAIRRVRRSYESERHGTQY